MCAQNIRKLHGALNVQTEGKENSPREEVNEAVESNMILWQGQGFVVLFRSMPSHK